MTLLTGKGQRVIIVLAYSYKSSSIPGLCWYTVLVGILGRYKGHLKLGHLFGLMAKTTVLVSMESLFSPKKFSIVIVLDFRAHQQDCEGKKHLVKSKPGQRPN